MKLYLAGLFGNSRSKSKEGLNELDTIFKFVVKSPECFKEIQEDFEPHIDKDKIYIMPEGVLVEENIKVYAKINDTLLQYGYNTTPRLQNIMFDGALRGV